MDGNRDAPQNEIHALMGDKHPGLARVLRIAKEAYCMVPVGEALSIMVERPDGCRLANLMVLGAGQRLLTEHFSGVAVAMEFGEAITWTLERWRSQHRSHDSVRATKGENP